MTFNPPDEFNVSDYFLDARVREGKGDDVAIVTDDGERTYRQVQERANQIAHWLRGASVEPEQRVLIALPDGPDFVAAFFAILKLGAVVVMVNPELKRDDVRYFYDYTRSRVAIVDAAHLDVFRGAADGALHLRRILVPGEDSFEAQIGRHPTTFENFPTHRDDPAIWLFSGGTTGRPKAVAQTHTSFANTTECYAKQVLGYSASDATLSVPKLYFGYATGSNLLFPFAVGAKAVLFPEKCTADRLFEKIAKFRPTILINVPTMISHMVHHGSAHEQDLSCLRLVTSAGEALPVELHRLWDETFGVDLLDGLGTAEMWHIFITNRPGDVKPGTLGRVVPGFDVKVCDDDGEELPHGEVGWLWVRGNSRAIGYWQQMEKTKQAFRGEWYVSGDMVKRDEDGFFTYYGRGDDMLKVSGKWLSPRELENCLLKHPAIEEVAVVGVVDQNGLTKPHAFVVASSPHAGLGKELQVFATERLEPYKHPRKVVFLESLPRTHLGKVDRGRLRALSSS